MVTTKTEAPNRANAVQRVWQSMRILREFTAADILATAEVSQTHARKLIWSYSRAGYLRVFLHGRYDGPHSSRRTYRLIRNTGPLAPRIQRGNTRVYDPNRDLFFEIERHK